MNITQAHQGDVQPGPRTVAQPATSPVSQPVREPVSPQLARPGLASRLWHQRWFIALRSFAVFFALWYVAYWWNGNPLQLPSPVAVATALWDLAESGEMFDHASISALRLVIALLVAVVLAVPLGFWMGLSRTTHSLVDPLVEMLRPVSGIAWLPLALFIFGIGDTLPVFIMVYVAFFPILLNTVAGVHQVDRKLIAAAATMGVGRRALLLHVVVPGALPMVMVGIRLAFAASWAAIVAAELIGAPSGLGFAIEWYRQLLMTPKVFAFIAVIGFVGYLCDVGLRALQRYLTPWSEGTGLQ